MRLLILLLLIVLPIVYSVDCASIQDRALCSQEPSCNYYFRRLCKTRRRKRRRQRKCILVKYGCQDITSFCSFNKNIWPKFQCNVLNKMYCKWENNQCVRRGWCNNLCWWRSYNGLCEDGGPNSTNYQLCMLGTDCNDCGTRYL